jgi:hypothetical protein
MFFMVFPLCGLDRAVVECPGRLITWSASIRRFPDDHIPRRQPQVARSFEDGDRAKFCELSL